MSDEHIVSVSDYNKFSPDKCMGPNLDHSGNKSSLNSTSDLPFFALKEASDLLRTVPRIFAKYINEIEKREERKRGLLIWSPPLLISYDGTVASDATTTLTDRSHISFIVSGLSEDAQKAQRFYGIDAIWKVGFLLRGPLGDFLRMQLYKATKALLSRDEVYDIYRESQGLKGHGHGFIMCYKKDYHYLFLICPRYKTPQEIPDSALEPRFRKGFDASGMLRKNSKFYPIAVDHFRTRLLVFAPIYNEFRQLCYLKVRKRLSSDHFLRLLQGAPKIFEESEMD